MKAKLEAIREALEYASDNSPNFKIVNKTDKGIVLVDTLLAELEGEELVEKVAKAICTQILINQDEYPELQPTDPTSAWYREDQANPQQIWELNKQEAKAAINSIKGV